MTTHTFPVSIDGQPQAVVVRPNNDGFCAWYVLLLIDDEESDDLPHPFKYFHGDGTLKKGADNKDLFDKAEQEALAEAQKLINYLQEEG